MKQDENRSDHEEEEEDQMKAASSSMLAAPFAEKLTMVLTNTMILILLHQIFIQSSTIAALSTGHHVPPRHSLLLDRDALLRIKSAVTYDPFGTLSNWNLSTHVCHFNSVTCNRHEHRVSKLILNNSYLVGSLSPFISNLTNLRMLAIINSHFSGTIPEEISRLWKLKYLRLEGNEFSGRVPASFFSSLPEILTMNLLENRLNGTLSAEYFSNCSKSLQIIDLSKNFYIGNIPGEIGNCVSLLSLNLYNNGFTGELPRSLSNTSLRNLDVEYNRLSGELPVEIVRRSPDLLFLHLSYNNMTSHDGNTNLGPFFKALKGCSILEEIEIAGMGLGGTIPDSVGQLGESLSTMLLQENNITGTIPSAIRNLSKLTLLNFTSNRLSGTFPPEIYSLPGLEQLFLSHNEFSGPIPEAIGISPHIGLLDLSHNRFSGNIPKSLGNFSKLIYLFLNNNDLSGKIPSSLGRCTELHKIDLSHNRLSGKIPAKLLPGMNVKIFLNFSNNHLEGPLPFELSKLKDIQEIDLSSNHLNGSIFSLISSCIAVSLINFSHNSLSSELPNSLGDLKNLEVLDLSWNKLSGQIPTSLNKSQVLRYLNLSFNNFEGPVPTGGVFSSLTKTSFLNNSHLCAKNITGLKPCRSRKSPLIHSRASLVIFSAVIFVSGFFSVICCMIGFRRAQFMISSRQQRAARRKPRTPPDLILNFPRITYRELSEATAGFDDQRLVGSGSYGRVYRGVLSDGTAVAVKVLHVQSGNSTKSFTRECQVLKRIRHRNLIRIITACSLPDFKALVLPYMANGSLDSRLYPHSGTGLGSGSSDLNLLQRVNICSDVAEGMAYLHHHSPVKVIHCDLKPSNVLLNDDMTALVSDFGIARLVMTAAGGIAAFENMGNSTANMLVGSIGYIAPEYGYGSRTSTKGDVYSFGVLVLEMVTRKRPTDDMFGPGLSLHRWVKSHYHGRVERVVDSSLLRASNNQLPEVKKMWEVAIGELIELGILCTQESPSTRPTMLDAADDLDRLKRYLFGDTTATFASSLGISSSTHEDD